MEYENIIIAIISLIGTGFGTFGGILASTKLSNYRIEQLEKKVEKHNSVVERTFILEGEVRTIENEVKEIKEDVHTLVMTGKEV